MLEVQGLAADIGAGAINQGLYKKGTLRVTDSENRAQVRRRGSADLNHIHVGYCP